MKRFFRRLIALALVIAMMIPANVFAAETTITQSTKNNVDRIISYADQLRNSSNSNSTTSGFVWDTEKKTYSWSYFNGLMMDAYMDLGGSTNFNFVDTFYNANISSDGSIVNVTQGKVSTGALDFCEPLRATFDLLRTSSRASKYKSAIQKWYRYLEDQIVYTNCGGNYAHKQDNTSTVSSSWAEYPVALDGLYMAQPFLMETANAIDAGLLTIKDKNGRTVSSSSIYNAVYNRFVWIYNNLYNPSTGLYDHGYNPSTRKTNGVSWSRSIGWYVMALVDVIDMMPAGSMKTDLMNELPRIFDGLLRYQDASGLWYNVTAYNSSLWGNNQNILETSGSSMFGYAMVKATQKGFVSDSKYYDAAVRAFNGVVNTKLRGSQGNYSVVDTYKSSGASTNPSYYCNNSYTTNEAKGIGSLIMLAALLKNNSTVGSQNAVIPDVPMQTITTTTYERATTIDTKSEYLMASGSSGNVKILGHNGYYIFNSDATVANNQLTSAFSHANGNDAYYLWKFSEANTAANQTSNPVISNATPLGSNEPVSYIQNWDRNQIGAWGGGITVVNKGGYFTMKQWDNYIDAGNTQNATSAKNIYLFKKVVTTTQVPAVHEHTYELIGETAGNCKTKGTKTYRCSDCQEEKVEETRLGDHNFTFTKEVPGTCVTKGYKLYTCSICNETRQEETVLGDHNFTFTKEVPGTCITKGYKLYTCTLCDETKQEITAYGDHAFEVVGETTGNCITKGVQTSECSICGETKETETVYGDHAPKFDHTVIGDCSHKGYDVYVCELCGNETTEATTYGDHNYTYTKDVTGDCSHKGYKLYTCSICNGTKQEETTFGDHSYTFTKEVPGNCVTKGYKLYTCPICGDTKQEETTLGDHNYTFTKEVPGTCITKGYKLYTCSLCGDTKQEITSYGNHAFEIIGETEGNCVTKGVQTSECSICGELKENETVYGAHAPKFDHTVTGDCSHKGHDVYVCELCRNETTKETTYGDHSYTYTKDVTGDCSHKGYKLYTCSICRGTKQEETTYGDHNYTYTKDVPGTCVTKGYKLYTCSICGDTRQEETTLGTHSYQLIEDVPAVNGNNGYKRYQCSYCKDTYDEVVEPQFEIVEETVTTVTYELATSITPGGKYIIASGKNGNVTIIGNNNGSAFKATANAYNGRIDMAGKNLNQFFWTFASASSGKISNNGLYVKTSSASQFNTTGEQMSITNLGGGAYQIKKTTGSGVTSYLNPNNLTSKTSGATTVYLFKEVKTTTVNRYEVHIEYESTTSTVYERATTIQPGSEYLMASGSSGNVKILGHSGYNVYNSDATVTNGLLTSAFSHANGNDANYLWKFSEGNTATNQTSNPVISNATSLSSNDPIAYIQNWDRNQIGAWGGGITVVNKGGYFTMKQWDNYIDAGSTQNATSARNIYLFKKTLKTTTEEKRVLVKIN